MEMEVQPELQDLPVLQVQVVKSDSPDQLDQLDLLVELGQVAIKVSRGPQVVRVNQVLMEIWDLRVNLVQVEHQGIQVNLDSRVLLVRRVMLDPVDNLDHKDFLGILDQSGLQEELDFLGIQERPDLWAFRAFKVQTGNRVPQEVVVILVLLEILEIQVKMELLGSRVFREIMVKLVFRVNLDQEEMWVNKEALDCLVLQALSDQQDQLGNQGFKELLVFQASRVMLDLWASMAWQGSRDLEVILVALVTQGLLELLDRRAFRDRRVEKVLLDCLDLRVHRVRMAILVRGVILVEVDSLDRPVTPVLQVRKVHRGQSGFLEILVSKVK